MIRLPKILPYQCTGCQFCAFKIEKKSLFKRSYFNVCSLPAYRCLWHFNILKDLEEV